MNDIQYIRTHVPEDELLAQLAEEAVELAHAALKLRRVGSSVNPTPVARAEAEAKLEEELADVVVCLEVLCSHNDLADKKAARWRERIEREKSRRHLDEDEVEAIRRIMEGK